MGKNLASEIINTKQFIWLLFIIITSFTVLQVPGLLIFQAGRDAWLSVIAAWLLDTILALASAYMGLRFMGKSYIEYSITILGKTFGKLVGLLFIIFFIIVSANLMRALSMNIGNIFLPKTPIIVVLLSAYITIAYIARKGIEVIARICEVLGPIYLLSFIGLFLLALPFFNLEQLKPQFDRGFLPFLEGSFLSLSYIGICIAMGWYIPFCNHPENGFLAKFTALSLGSIIISLVIIFSIGVFGVEQAGNMTNPSLQLLRMVHIADYFERMEVIWMVVAIGAGIMTTINAIWISCLSIAQIAGLDSYKPLIFPVALISFILSLTSFHNNIVYLNFSLYVFPIFGLLVESLPLLLLVAALITGKKGKTT